MLGSDSTLLTTSSSGTPSSSKSSSTVAAVVAAAVTTDKLSVVPDSKRKFSFPVALHSSLLLGEASTLSARRRFSNVSDVVTRKLSNTIGWKLPTIIPTQDIIMQGKCLCGQYIRFRLKRSGVFTKKLGLQRIRSIIGTPTAHILREVFPALHFIGQELERMHPALYTSVVRQITRSSGGDLQAAETATVLLSAVARDLFRNDITWGKVVSLFAITGGLAIDCVRQDHPEYLPKLVEGMGDVVEDELVAWINENGGWGGLSTHVSPANTQCSYIEWITLAIGCAFSVFLLYFLLRFVGYHLISHVLWIR